MRKKILLFMVIGMVILSSFQSKFAYSVPQEDSKQLQYQDMLMLFLLPKIQRSVEDYYSKLLTEPPVVYPYMVDVLKSQRVNGFRGFHFLIIMEVNPVVGPHISVGKDRLTFEITPVIPDTAKLIRYEHVKTDELPAHWQHIIRRPVN